MARKKASTKDQFITVIEEKIMVLMKQELDPKEMIQLINAATRLATARFKISGDDSEGAFFND